ncbi:HNH endonuclease [Aeribacillus composti]|uniref:HNH endonuclease n=1 Tax=Aeribacillus composti TaxID=1868734 RepID=UPI001F554A1A
MVHHIVPLEKRPDLKLMSWNLISFCNKCHESMHNRNTDELSEKGMQWVERVRHHLENNPPYQNFFR